MSEPWTSLLAALVGAIVGGAASLAGTMLANKMQIATNARMRMYNELLPELERVLIKHSGEDRDDRGEELVWRLERTSGLAGREERRAASKIVGAWFGVLNANQAVLEAPAPHPWQESPKTDVWRERR